MRSTRRSGEDGRVCPKVPSLRVCALMYCGSASRKGGESACRPGSVPPLARGGGHPSGTAVADSLLRSTREHRAGRPRSLAQGTFGSPLDLAPGGVYRATAVTCGAGGLLHRRFTLTPRTRLGAVCFLWHCPAGHPGSALPTTLPYGARTFLTGPAPGAAARPTHPRIGYAERHRPAWMTEPAPANDASDSTAAGSAGSGGAPGSAYMPSTTSTPLLRSTRTAARPISRSPASTGIT